MAERRVFPEHDWQVAAPGDVGLRHEGMRRVRAWLDERATDRGYRFIVVKDGMLAAEWNRGIASTAKLHVASTWKSMLSNVLGIAIAEGKLSSADAEVYDYYPQLMDVPEGGGPKDGRYAFPKDRHITFRQLISNTSGYMKPNEEPGTVFHYQTYGMNVLAHALATLYDLHDAADPAAAPGFAALLQAKVAAPIQAAWDYSTANFEHGSGARVEVFGYGTRIATTARDLARAGWLWCNYGAWGDRQLVPEAWMRESTRTAPAISAHCDREHWLYGQGFWSNADGVLWPDLPRDGFHSWGAGGHYAVMFPSLGLVIVQNPDPFGERGGSGANPALVSLVLDAVVE